MSWHKITMSVEQVANSEHAQLQDQVEQIIMAAGAPRDVTMFSSGLSGNDGLSIYFSPAASTLLEVLINSHNATTCDAPSSENLALLIGHADAKDYLL